jgi:hypothetical protein
MEVPGWRAVDETLTPVAPVEVDRGIAEETDMYGCGECDMQFPKDKLHVEVLGTDGKPLPYIHDGQESLL